MMTKEQAAQAWCPMTRLVVLDAASNLTAGAAPMNRGQVPGGVCIPPAVQCIADRCAMWRWSDPLPELTEPEEWSPLDDAYDDDGMLQEVEPARPEGVPADATWVQPTPPSEHGWQDGGYWVESEESVVKRHAVELAKRCGYCGLAGRPV